MSLREVEQLRERVAELEAILGLTAINPDQRPPGLSRAAAALLGVLISRPFVSRAAAYEALYGMRADCEQPRESIIAVHMTWARKFLRPHGIAIHNSWGAGWYLAPDDQRRVRELLGDAVSGWRG